MLAGSTGMQMANRKWLSMTTWILACRCSSACS